MPEIAKRTYSSPLRAQSARRTRLLVRDAAARLFTERGFVSTTVRNVAEAAGVSTRTVFTAFPGGKAELFHEALHAAIDGDFGAPRPRTPRDGDPVERILDQMVGYSTGILERAGTLMVTSIESSGADPDMRRFAEDGARASAENAMTLAEGLAAHELLRPEISVQRAADVLFTVVSPQVYSMLRRQCGWDVDEYRNWVKATIRASLLH
ncbi:MULTISPECIES: TetR/AcrR family transcriptional regulator [unclassified Rhodococcus (in: high G+C Gram-positive bacteria)]|uniref:TetR/AcrR family transcriptional regulator n=1 Tax=unclassified Rhodococcus (in: high G+C Gram-positive bacteria) TaxID=192944 RepID=UPI00163A204E|nr:MULTISPECIES: TetR/AcrR family transcriptional regulator [unclassified Rhodococcus (in: high G+C Gram-positive bacteria)]MBC2638517.1 TetR/AcrR family transcriptional regulator [Rhodococcus sp. 3A]MBC2896742.1 TetR/AcrR family transcriptional regulator [Rhodococcus sp. 4CII]